MISIWITLRIIFVTTSRCSWNHADSMWCLISESAFAMSPELQLEKNERGPVYFIRESTVVSMFIQTAIIISVSFKLPFLSISLASSSGCSFYSAGYSRPICVSDFIIRTICPSSITFCTIMSVRLSVILMFSFINLSVMWMLSIKCCHLKH